MLASYRAAADETGKELVIEKLKEMKDWAPDTAAAPAAAAGVAAPAAAAGSASATVQLLAALTFFEAKNYKEALRYVHKAHEQLEHLALCVEIYLRIDRPDLAAKALKFMQDIDDDDTLTALANVWTNVAQGGDRAQEAFHLLEELIEKLGPSPLLYNTMGVCQMALRKWPEAFGYLKQARELALSQKEKVSAETLVNSAVCLQQMHKAPDLIARIITELKASHPSHAWIQKYTAIENIFDSTAANFVVKK